MIQAGADQDRTISETARLYEITGKKVESSRFHFLRLRFPQSYRSLLAAGIRQDYTMGFADEPGFRAGIARPFQFYDLVANEPADITVIPFQYMDVTLSRYRALKPDEALKLVADLITEVKNVGGLFVSIWHNTSLLDDDEGNKWRGVYEGMLKNLTQ